MDNKHRHRTLISLVFVAFVAIFCTRVSAQDTQAYAHPYPDHEQNNELRYVGTQLDVSELAGAALGIDVHPLTNVLRLSFAGTFNSIAPGIRGSATLDPIEFIVAPTLTLQYGGTFAGKITGTSARVSCTYFDMLPGIEVGSRSSFRLFARGGTTWTNINITRFNTTINKDNIASDAVINNITFHVGDPKIKSHFIPALQLGFSIFF